MPQGGKGSEDHCDKQQSILSAGQLLDSGRSWDCLAAGKWRGAEFEGWGVLCYGES